jgi:hypothetical protein
MRTTQHAQLVVRCSPAERRAVKRAAVDLDVSVSALARRALRDYLARRAAEPVRREEHAQ